MTKPKPKPDNPDQFERFKEAVKDTDPQAFESALDRLLPRKAPATEKRG